MPQHASSRTGRRRQVGHCTETRTGKRTRNRWPERLSVLRQERYALGRLALGALLPAHRRQVQLDLQGGDPQGDTSCLPSYVLQQPGSRRDESQGAPVRDGPQRNRGDAQHVHASWLRGGSRGDEPAIRLNMRGVRSSVLHHFLHRIGMKKTGSYMRGSVLRSIGSRSRIYAVICTFAHI